MSEPGACIRTFCFLMELTVSCLFLCCFSLVLGKLLGEGAFGMVVKAEVLGITGRCTAKTVAVKMLRGQCHDT